MKNEATKNNNHLKNDSSIVGSIIFKLEPEFVSKLAEEFPKLVEEEIKICVLIKNNFNHEEIANYMSMLEEEVPDAISSIEKKLRKNYKQTLHNILQTN